MAREKDTHDHHDHQTTDDEKEGKGAFAKSKYSNVSLLFTLVVSHVCRRWRNIALLTPSLWTTIVVTLEVRPPYERVSTLLKRSKSLPIDILVNWELDDCDDTSKLLFLADKLPSLADFELLLAMLVPHIHRWRTMEVTTPMERLAQEFLSAVSDPSVPTASQLTTLELYDLHNVIPYDALPYYRLLSNPLTLFGGSAPLLTRIVLWGVYVDWDQPWIASASNLRDLVLAYHPEAARPSFAQFCAILRNAPALEKLSLRNSGPARHQPAWSMDPSSPVDFDAPIQLARLTDFVLAFNVQARATWLMRKFTFPALKNLVLDFDGDGDYTEFVEQLARPATSLSASQASCSSLSGLESLKIDGLACSIECIKMLYGELQTLRSLNLVLYRVDPWFLDILSTACTLPGRGGIWLPRLTTLLVSGASGSALREVVSKRKKAGVPLSSLFVEVTHAVDDGDAEWLEENVDMFELFEGIGDGWYGDMS